MKTRHGNKGFTLIEMMVVVAIIGIAATIAIPSYIKALPHIRMKAAARSVASTLQLTRMSAIARNMTTVVHFNGTNSYVFDAAHQAQNEDWYGKVGIYFDTTGYGKFIVPSFSGGRVTFDSYGRAKSLVDASHTEEAVYLKAIPYTNEDWRVRVSSLSGMVTVEHWDGVSKWEE